MGGFGSGQWQQGKPLTSERMALDIRVMQRPSKGCGTDYVQWQGGGSVYVKFQDYVATVEVRFPSQASQRRVIELERTEPHFGGYRNWWKCPGCRARVGMLYWNDWRWQCRKCAGLVHESTRQTEDTLAYARVDRIREKLGWGGGMLSPMGGRPKGMHMRTFARLMRELTEASIHAAGAGADRIDMLTERLLKTRIPR